MTIKTLLTILGLSFALTTTAMADDKPGMDMKGHDMGTMSGHDMKTTESSVVMATGVVNTIAEDKVNVKHDPIKAIGWPTMTMDFKVKPGTDVSHIKAGDKVTFGIAKGDDSIYQIVSIKQAD